MKKVKLSFPPEKWDIKKYSPSGTFVWGDYEFFFNEDIAECDFWFVLGNLVHDTETTIVSPENIILDAQENPDIIQYPQSFLNQFGSVSSYRTDIKHKQFIKSVPIIPWFVEKNFEELSVRNNFTKTKKISLLTSNKKITINHVKRLNFVKKLHNYFGSDIDIYGAGYSGYVAEKKSVLEPYMYTISLENFECPEYFSEKFGDPLLTETFPIYHGCPNLSEYFNANSYQEINMNDFDNSVKSIKKILDTENFYESRLEVLTEAKMKYLNNYSIFPVMVNILKQVELLNKNKSLNKVEVRLSKFDSNSLLKKITNRFKIECYDFFN